MDVRRRRVNKCVSEIFEKVDKCAGNFKFVNHQVVLEGTNSLVASGF